MSGLDRTMSRRRAFAGLAGMAGLAAAAACAPARPAAPARLQASELIARPEGGEWPAAVMRADANTQAAYRFAASHADVLRYMPCYCGCAAEGHRSNLDCFVREVRGASVELDAHGLNCGTCVGIALDAMAMTKAGLPPATVRARIDARWGRAGPPTDTPLPP